MASQRNNSKDRTRELQNAIVDLAGALSAIYHAHTLSHAQQVARQALDRVREEYVELFEEE